MDDEIILLDTARVSRSRSLRMSLPKRIAEKLRVDANDIIGFYTDRNGDIRIRKLR